MKKRSPIGVFFLCFIPFYAIYWIVSTGREMRAKGADLPTAWLLIIPFVNIWWLYKYSAAVEHVTNGKSSTILTFILIWLLGSIGYAIVQDSFNKVDGTPMGGITPAPTVAPMPSEAYTPPTQTVVTPEPTTQPVETPQPPTPTLVQ